MRLEDHPDLDLPRLRVSESRFGPGGWGKRRRAPRGSRRAKARRLLCSRAGLLPRRTPLHLCRANDFSVVSSHTAVTPSPLRLSRHQNTSSSQTNYNFPSFPFLIHSRCFSLSRVGGHPCGLPIPLWFSCSSHAGLTTRLHPIGARRCLAFALMKRETRGSPWHWPSPTSRQRESARANSKLPHDQTHGLRPRSSLFAAAFIAAGIIETEVLKMLFAKPTARSRPSQM